MPKSVLGLYQKYFQERQFERLDLFKIIADSFNVQRALYPGSFVHITPSFVFPDVVYVDNDNCKPYLRTGGFLVANNSHGDAGMAAIDDDYQLKAVFLVRNGRHRISKTNLDEYFVPKLQIQITKDYLERLQKGIGYKKAAGVYLFQKVSSPPC